MTYPERLPGKFTVIAFSALIGLMLLSGCAQSSDPCEQMMQEVKEVRSLEKQLTKTESQIKKFTAAKDTADLNQALGIQADLRARHKAARIAAANMAASCVPPQLGVPESDQQQPPLDPNQDVQKNGR
jgi:glucose-6-phosphate-specific signal transduction histidine kinase